MLAWMRTMQQLYPRAFASIAKEMPVELGVRAYAERHEPDSALEDPRSCIRNKVSTFLGVVDNSQRQNDRHESLTL